MTGPRLLLPLVLAPLLSGCIAVAALPLVAGGAMVAGGNVRIKAATPRPDAEALAKARQRGEMTAGSGVTLTALTALPPPDVVAAARDPWRRFVAYALDHGAQVAAGRESRSVLLEAGTSLELPRTRSCTGKAPAVLIDLDPGTRPFVPAAAAAPSPEVAAGLARLRAAGVTVAWISGLPARYVGEVAEVLRVSGLDPAGEDPLLLARGPDDRKQLLRTEANEDVCVIALAGDGKADFDELFAYLRDPASAAGLDYLIGAGWFIVPSPLGA